MSKKYIIEIENDPITKEGVELWKACGFNALVFDQCGLDKLTPYPTDDNWQSYNKGLNDAWEAAKKITFNINRGGMPTKELAMIFGEFNVWWEIMERITASEAIAKLKEYEQKQADKIEVGDEVIYGHSTAIVSKNNSCSDYNRVYIIYEDGSVPSNPVEKRDVQKTGRHFPEIAAVLEKMREELDGHR